MRKLPTILAICILFGVAFSLNVSIGKAQAEGEANQDTLLAALRYIDGSIVALRIGDNDGAKSSLGNAETEYKKFHIENVDNALDIEIKNAFSSLKNSPQEENIRTLRANIVLAASKIGLGVPFHLEYAMFTILGVSALLALLVTFISKRTIDWASYKQMRAQLMALQKELRDAQRKRDMKRIHKIQPEVTKLMGKTMGISMRQMIYTIPPYFIAWIALAQVYSGWVVAWLPFSLPLPFWGTWVSAGFLSWLIITYFGFSTIFRKLIIGEF
jgi:uncharacterized membrane protein (DUF106 family)